MASKPSTPLVVRKDVVAQSLEVVRAAKIHTQFSAYLALRLAGAQSGAGSDFTSVPIQKFFDRYLRVDGLPAKKPYLRPFDAKPPSTNNLLMNSNVAGSFATSSLREVAPFRQVIEITGTRSDTRYAFRENHWELALEHLAYGIPVPALPLAIFLFRDYGFKTRSQTVSLGLVLDVFLDLFGYRGDDGSPSEEFNTLYGIAPLDVKGFPFESRSPSP